MRYTRKQLKTDIEQVNTFLSDKNIDIVVIIESRTTHINIDIATNEQAKRYTTIGQIASGTPSQCITKVYAWLGRQFLFNRFPF
jgi:hypothetical protein